MKTIFIQNEKFEWGRFEYEALSDLRAVLKASLIQLGDSCKLGEETKLDNSRAIFILNGYKYSAGGHFNKLGVQMIQLGCFTRTRQEWDEDFWNSTKEFPDDKSEASEARVRTYKTICFFLDSLPHTGDSNS